MEAFDSLGARQLPPEEDDETLVEVWGGKEIPLNSTVIRDSQVIKNIQKKGLIAQEDFWRYLVAEIKPVDLVDALKSLANKRELLIHFEMYEVALYEEVI